MFYLLMALFVAIASATLNGCAYVWHFATYRAVAQ